MNVRTLRPGTKPWAISEGGIRESTSSSSQRWIRLRRGFGKSAILRGVSVGGSCECRPLNQKRSETPASSEPRDVEAEAVSVTGGGAADSVLSNDGRATSPDAIRLPAQ